MKKWTMIVDVARCHDCNNCFLACKDEHVGNDFPPHSVAQPWSGHRWMNIFRRERGQYPRVRVSYLPMPCLHCERAPCLTDDGAVYERADGVVVIDPDKAAGRREIVESCPLGAIYWNEERSVAQKCTGCVHLLEDGWTETRCTQVCPTGALSLVLADEAEIARIAAEQGLKAYRPDLIPRARVFYKNLHLFTKSLIAGGIVFADTDECAEGVSVRLILRGEVVGEVLTNSFGDFVFDGLDAGNGYELRVEAAGYRPLVCSVALKESVNLGCLSLTRV